MFTLQTVNRLRKYSSFLDIPMSFLLGRVVYVSKLSFWCSLYSAMSEHASQFVWYRKLYVLFSRYMLINTYEKLNLKLNLHNSHQQPSQSGKEGHYYRLTKNIPLKFIFFRCPLKTTKTISSYSCQNGLTKKQFKLRTR